jgi:hypothetical protein
MCRPISDITIHGEKVGIHVEPGMWIHVPSTNDSCGREKRSPAWHRSRTARRSRHKGLCHPVAGGPPNHRCRGHHAVPDCEQCHQDQVPQPDRQQSEYTENSAGPDSVHYRAAPSRRRCWTIRTVCCWHISASKRSSARRPFSFRLLRHRRLVCSAGEPTTSHSCWARRMRLRRTLSPRR